MKNHQTGGDFHQSHEVMFFSPQIEVGWFMPMKTIVIYRFISRLTMVYGRLCLRVENRTSVLHVSMSFMVLTGWGGVGWGGVIRFICTAWHTCCYAAVRLFALPHMHDATLLYVFLHVLTYMMLRCCTSSCTSSHIWCYASVRRLALPHIHDATLLYVALHFLTYMMLR